jgi:CRISPR-associated protein Csd1
MNLLDNPEAAQVANLFASVHGGRESHALDDPNAFFLLGLSGNAARAIIRHYLEVPLPLIRNHLQHWFQDLRITDISREGAGKPTNLFPLWQLVAATAREVDEASPDVPARLLGAALLGVPLSDSTLASCLNRLRAEGSSGFRSPRMGLIKLILLRRNISVTETLNPEEAHPAYVCGELLAVFEQIQRAALGDINATVTDKFFGNFSAAPAPVLGRLFAGAQNHLRKLRGEKPGAFIALERLLTQVTSKLKVPPRGQLSLEDQGRFALGYYHLKARRFEELAERKAARAEQNVSV